MPDYSIKSDSEIEKKGHFVRINLVKYYNQALLNQTHFSIIDSLLVEYKNSNQNFRLKSISFAK